MVDEYTLWIYIQDCSWETAKGQAQPHYKGPMQVRVIEKNREE